jgi:hypothetical protein
VDAATDAADIVNDAAVKTEGDGTSSILLMMRNEMLEKRCEFFPACFLLHSANVFRVENEDLVQFHRGKSNPDHAGGDEADDRSLVASGKCGAIGYINAAVRMSKMSVDKDGVVDRFTMPVKPTLNIRMLVG